MSSFCKKVISFCLACFLFVTICGGLNQTEASQIPLDDSVVTAARKLCKQYGIDAALLWAVIECESNFNVNSGNSYCKGLMAVHKSYASYYAKKAGMSSYDLFDPIDNIHIGLEMLKEHINKYGDTEDALIAYNNGDGGAQSYFNDGIHSTSYSRKVKKARAKWQAVEDAEAAEAAAAEKAAKEKAEREAAEKAAAEKAAKEKAEREAAEQAAREAAEKAAKEKAEREAAERAAAIAADEAKINAISTISVTSANKGLKALDLRVVRLSDLFV